MLGARLAGPCRRWAWPGAREGIARATGQFEGVEGGGHRVEVTSSSRRGKCCCAHHEPRRRRHHHPIPRSDLCHGLLTYATPGRAASTRYAPTRRTPGFSVLVYLYLCPLPRHGFRRGNRTGGGRESASLHASRVTAGGKSVR